MPCAYSKLSDDKINSLQKVFLWRLYLLASVLGCILGALFRPNPCTTQIGPYNSTLFPLDEIRGQFMPPEVGPKSSWLREHCWRSDD